ncbi:hypothetical protein D9M72_600130 [compost metagenome]
MDERLEVHDDRKDQDRVKRTVFQVAVFVERSLLNQHDRHRTDIHGADAEANRNDEEVLRQGEGADDAVKREAGIEDFEVKEGAKAAFCRRTHGLL